MVHRAPDAENAPPASQCSPFRPAQLAVWPPGPEPRTEAVSFRASVRLTEARNAAPPISCGHIDQRIETRYGDTDQKHRDIDQFSGAARTAWRHVPRPDPYGADAGYPAGIRGHQSTICVTRVPIFKKLITEARSALKTKPRLV